MQPLIDDYRLDILSFLKRVYPHFSDTLATPISCLSFFSTDTTNELNHIMYEPCLCVILQGSKAVGFGKQMYGYTTNEYLLASTHIPADIQITEASKELPYIGLTITFTLEDIYEVLKNTHPDKLKFQKKSDKGLFFDTMSPTLYDPIARLIKLTERSKEDIAFLSPFIIKEILYVLVNEKSGYFLNKFAMEGTTSNKIVKAIAEIKTHFSEKLNMATLAKRIDMSESHLYQNFKTITSLSPIQFQKKLRLEEAKRMLSVRRIDISEVAFLVGYESPSHFSREYARMFGMPPKAYLKSLNTPMHILEN
jgi:AraC-like DNA-binding protein